jgi:hypothetical protein
VANIKLTTADTSGFIPIIWAQRALDVLRNQIVALQFVARDTDFAEPGWRGKAITVGYPGTFTAVDKAADTPVTPQVPANGSSITLTLNKHKVVPFLVEDFAAAQANGSLMDRYIAPATIALAEQVENDVLSQFTGFTGGTVGTSGTNATSATVRTVDQQFNTLKSPQTDRILIVSPKDKAALLGRHHAPVVLRLFAAGHGQEWRDRAAVRHGRGHEPAGADQSAGGALDDRHAGRHLHAHVQRADDERDRVQCHGGHGAGGVGGAVLVGAGNVLVTGTTPTTAGGTLQVFFTGTLYGTTLPLTGSGASLTGTGAALTISTTTDNIAMHKNAVMFASRPFAPIPAGSGVMVAQANDPESGLSIRLSAQYDVNNIGMRCNLDLLYGMQVLRANQGFIVQA